MFNIAFLALKRFELSKLLLRFPLADKKISLQQNLQPPHPLMLFGKSCMLWNGKYQSKLEVYCIFHFFVLVRNNEQGAGVHLRETFIIFLVQRGCLKDAGVYLKHCGIYTWCVVFIIDDLN